MGFLWRRLVDSQYGANRWKEAANMVQTCYEAANVVPTEGRGLIIRCGLDEAANRCKRTGK
jgi:hypothetical protein